MATVFDMAMPRFLRTAFVLGACLAAGAIAPGTVIGQAIAPDGADAAVTVGISDQQAASFDSPLYAPLNLSVARYIAPYDVMGDAVQRGRLDAWVDSAFAAGQDILVSFEHSRVPGRESRVPSNAEFQREMKKFKAVYGTRVEAISPWNEVNVCQKNGRTEGQPPRICRSTTGPKIVAGYYRVARKVFTGKKIVALDVLDAKDVKPALAYVKAFRKVAKPKPKYWGIHNYSDTNRGSTSRTKALIAAIADRKAEIWLTETGGQIKLRGNVFGEAEAAKALKCMFSMPKLFPQIKRLYIYQFHGALKTEEFDAGLVDSTLKKKRAGYRVVQKRQTAKCRP